MDPDDFNMIDDGDDEESSTAPLTKSTTNRHAERRVSFHHEAHTTHHPITRQDSTLSRASLRRASLLQNRTGVASIRRPSTQSIASRGNWGSKWEFLLSCVGLSVGIGNVWRFPYLAYDNGGGAFLIPYLLMLLLAGKPMYFMELSFGQFAGVGPLSIWSCLPLAKGIGYAMVTVCLIVCIYYNVIMSYTLHYIGSSFQSVVPWSRCDLDWAKGTNCHVRGEVTNVTMNHSKTSSQVYWERSVLQLSDGIEYPGGINWELALCLLISWIIVIICLIKGIKTSGKVVYFAATFPYIILITLLITGLIQEGAFNGVLYFITPTWDKLLDIQVWQAAAGQMFFSLGVSMGALIMYSSYNDFRNNIFRDAMVVSILDTITSIISGIVIFSILGAMAHDLGEGTRIEDVVASGPGLAFVAYPEALSRLPVPQLWAVLFFLMLFILGLDSEFALLENVLTSISDEYPILRKHKMIFCIISGIFCYLLGLSCVTRGGQYVLELMDKYGGGTAIVFVAVMESLAIIWVYGLDRFCDDINFMLGIRPGIYWRFTWAFTTPIILAFIFIYSLARHKPAKYGNYDYPDWADGIGWFLALFSMLQIPIWAVIIVFKQKGKTLKAKIKQSMVSTDEWGPADEELKDDWKAGIHSIIMVQRNSDSEKYEAQENPAFTEYV